MDDDKESVLRARSRRYEWEDRLETAVFIVAIGAALCVGGLRFNTVREKRREISKELDGAKAQTYTPEAYLALCSDAAVPLRLPDPNEILATTLVELLVAANEGRKTTEASARIRALSTHPWLDPNRPESQRWTMFRDSRMADLRSAGFSDANINILFDPNVPDTSKWEIMHGWNVQQLEETQAGLPSPRESAILYGCIAFMAVICVHGVFTMVGEYLERHEWSMPEQ